LTSRRPRAADESGGEPPHAYPVPESPLLVLAPFEDDRVTWIRETCSAWGWRSRIVTSIERMAWDASVLRPAAVLIVDGGREWNIAVIETVRGVTTCPMVIRGALNTDRALAALRRGVDAIIPPGLAAEETLARVYAIIRRSNEVLA
jgi:DNA-binding response OmpR family regulator